jgi:plasmid maintenance system antidote protein VapI
MRYAIPPAKTLLEMANYNRQEVDYDALGISDSVAFRNGKLPITEEIATLLQQNGYATKQFWLNLQAIYERNLNDQSS